MKDNVFHSKSNYMQQISDLVQNIVGATFKNKDYIWVLKNDQRNISTIT